MSSIRAYLINNSAEKWDTRPSHALAESNPRRPASPDGDAVLEPDPSGDFRLLFSGRRPSAPRAPANSLPRRRIDRPVRPAKNRNSSASSSMKVCCLSACLVAAACAVAHAGSGDTQKLLDFYANQAKATDSAFGGFSAERGESLFRSNFYGRQARHPLLHRLPHEGPKKCWPDQSRKGH